LLSENVKTTIHKTIILPVVLYGREALALALSEANGLKVFENRLPRRIFESKRDEVRGGWRKLNNEQLHNLYSSTNIIRTFKSRRMRRALYEWGEEDCI
jgi:hypothetical protein